MLLSQSLHPRAGRQILNTDTMEETVLRVGSAVRATESAGQQVEWAVVVREW